MRSKLSTHLLAIKSSKLVLKYLLRANTEIQILYSAYLAIQLKFMFSPSVLFTTKSKRPVILSDAGENVNKIFIGPHAVSKGF